MEAWVRRKNIERFERDLRSESDPVKRRQLEDFLARERARLADIGRRDPRTDEC